MGIVTLNMLDPHVIALLFNIVLIVAVLCGIVVRSLGPIQTWNVRFRVSVLAVLWFAHAALFSILALGCDGDSGWCVQYRFMFLSPLFDFTDWSPLVNTHGILTVAYYVFAVIKFHAPIPKDSAWQ